MHSILCLLNPGILVDACNEGCQMVRIHVWVDPVPEVGNPPLTPKLLAKFFGCFINFFFRAVKSAGIKVALQAHFVTHRLSNFVILISV